MEKLNVTCLYHSRDLDGYCSGAIVKLRFPQCKLIGYDYGQPVPYDQIDPATHLYMVDVSLPMEEMAKLAKHVDNKFTWIDHHKSAISDFEEYIKYRVVLWDVVLDSSLAACELVWNHLINQNIIAMTVVLLGRYDTWRQKEGDWIGETLPFQYGMRLLCNSAETFPMHLLHTDGKSSNIIGITSTGNTILQYQKQVNEILCKNHAIEGTITVGDQKYRCICVNQSGANTQMFETVWDPEKYDIMVPFSRNKNGWGASLYTTKDIDVSVIAKHYGGGGHAKASGLNTKTFERLHSIFNFK